MVLLGEEDFLVRDACCCDVALLCCCCFCCCFCCFRDLVEPFLPPRPLVILPPDDEDEEEDGRAPLVPLPRVLRNASVRSEVNWVNRKSSRYFILSIYKGVVAVLVLFNNGLYYVSFVV